MLFVDELFRTNLCCYSLILVNGGVRCCTLILGQRGEYLNRGYLNVRAAIDGRHRLFIAPH